MSAIQENQTLAFGSARIYGTDANGIVLVYPELNDIQIDVKIDLKEAFGEGNYPFAVVDSHRSIDMSAKHYLLDEQGLTDTLGGTLSTDNLVGYVIDELHTVGEATAHEIICANIPVLTLESVVVFVTVGSAQVPIYYVATSGSPVAGVSYSVDLTTGVLTFASGDTGYPAKITYSFTAGEALGSNITVATTFQNSQFPLTMTCLRRDRSRVDASTHYTAWEFAQVRDGGIKAPYKEGDYTMYERTFKAYGNPFGQVLTVRMFNE
jgi:hypothetical protein